MELEGKEDEETKVVAGGGEGGGGRYSLIKEVKLGQHTSNSRTHTQGHTLHPLASLVCCLSANLGLVAAKARDGQKQRREGQDEREVSVRVARTHAPQGLIGGDKKRRMG